MTANLVRAGRLYLRGVTRLACFTVSLATAFALGWFTQVSAEPPKASKNEPVRKGAPTQFIRLLHDDDKELAALQTATVRYVAASGQGDLVVDLIGVVHIGDRDYYQKLNKQFEQYDVLLYELVAPQGTRIPKGGRSATDNPLAMLQTVMKSVLGLETQTDLIDYTKANFVHADLSPAEMAQAIQNRGDTGLTLALSVAADIMRQQNLQQLQPQKAQAQEPDLDLLSLLLDPDASVKLKRLMAPQLATLGGGTGLGPTINTILIGDRNAAAIKVFQKELAKGRKKIGIFYGAAHMPDFEQHCARISACAAKHALVDRVGHARAAWRRTE